MDSLRIMEIVSTDWTMQIKATQITRWLGLLICGVLISYLFSQIAEQSGEFAQGDTGAPGIKRPIIEVIKLFWWAFGAYLIAWAIVGGFSKGVSQTFQNHKWVDYCLILGFAIWFRIIMTPTAPIQEIDLYRYIWDGAVVANKLDPYQFGPKTIIDATTPDANPDREGLDDYLAILDERPGLNEVLGIVHYGNYTSPYPPVSQFFFAASVSCVKKDASANSYIVSMKTMLVVFDLLTGIVLAMLLYHVGMSPVLSLAYLWCPLVIKEIANGGHLDSITTFFMTVAIYLAARAMWQRKTPPTEDEQRNTSPTNDATPVGSPFFSAFSAVSLAAAIAAKVFPIVLIPIWFIALVRRTGIQAVFALFLLIASTAVFCFPMAKHLDFVQKLEVVSESEADRIEQADPSGIEAFSKFWEMNDFLFMIIVENLKPDRPGDKLEDGSPNYQRVPWFRITSSKFRERSFDNLQPRFIDKKTIADRGYSTSHVTFFITRILTLGILALITIWFCIKILFRPTANRWLELSFLTLAWFWLLSPTQNPWYWTWTIPLLVFATGRAWFFMSGLVFAYYLRFWFGYHFDKTDVIGELKVQQGDPAVFDWIFPLSDTFRYQGNTFFDMYIPFLEFGPWFVLLIAAAVFRRLTSKPTSDSQANTVE